jgi:hypothetical protein
VDKFFKNTQVNLYSHLAKQSNILKRYVVDKDDLKDSDAKISVFTENVVKHEFYKAFGSAVKGWDISSRLRMCYLNTSLLSFEKK